MSQRMMHGAMLLTGLATVLPGCSTMPAFGPDATAINRVAIEGADLQGNTLPFQVINVTTDSLPKASQAVETFPIKFREEQFRDTDETVEVGDKLEIRIWEVADDGLFATAGKRETVLNVRVSNSGNITVPYADRINAQGLTTSELRHLLLERYQGKVVEPEIAVTIVATESRSVTVLGEVRGAGRIAIPPRGIRLLDLIAQTGGVPQPTWEISISVQRADTSASLGLSEVMDNITNNIVILPGDTVQVSHEPRRFAVYGGVSRPSNIKVPVENAHLAYLLAEVGGLNDRVAQTRSVYVFRPAEPGKEATAYRFDFSRPDALLLANAFRLKPSDITYVASADAADLQRFMSIILSPLLGVASTTSNLGD